MRGLMPRRPLSRESLMLFRRPPIEYRGRPHGAYVSRSGIAIRYLMPASTCGDCHQGGDHLQMARHIRRIRASGAGRPHHTVLNNLKAGPGARCAQVTLF
jgi:hypothetical protein